MGEHGPELVFFANVKVHQEITLSDELPFVLEAAFGPGLAMFPEVLLRANSSYSSS